MADRYKKLVAEARKRVTEISPEDTARRVRQGEATLIDVRETEEWNAEHITGALHLSRGTIESEVEDKLPDPNATIICHCGGGGRSALVAQNLQRMGYSNVYSMAGGLKAWRAAGLPTEQSKAKSS